MARRSLRKSISEGILSFHINITAAPSFRHMTLGGNGFKAVGIAASFGGGRPPRPAAGAGDHSPGCGLRAPTACSRGGSSTLISSTEAVPLRPTFTSIALLLASI